MSFSSLMKIGPGCPVLPFPSSLPLDLVCPIICYIICSLTHPRNIGGTGKDTTLWLSPFNLL